MAFLSDAAAGILTPEEVGPLIIEPIKQASVAMQVTSVVQADSPVFRFPVVDTDAAANWVPEGQIITESDPGVSEEVVTPLKVAALVKISSELAEDSSPEAASLVQESLARSVARAIDRAFFANATINGPSGLLSLSGIQTVAVGSTFENFDWAVTAKALLRKVGSTPTTYVASADTVAALSTIKSFVGTDLTSNLPALAATDRDVSAATPESVLGVPLVAVEDSVSLADNLVWGIDKSKVWTVIRRAVTLDVTPHLYFDSDSIAVRVTCRVGFGYPHHAAIVRVFAGGS